MSIFSTASTFIQRTFTVATNTVDSADKILDIGNDYITNQHKKITRTVKADAIAATAEHLEMIDTKLKASPTLKAKFDALEAEW